MRDAALLVLPLLYLTLVGAGAAALLAPRLPPDAQVALAPVVGAALVAAGSVLLPLGASARAVAVAVAVGGAATSVVFGRTLRRAAALPLALALVAAGLAAAPALARGDWSATSLYGSTDGYHWVSQARSYLDGPPPPPATLHPDRLTYERSHDQQWAVAVPFTLLQLAWAADEDPRELYAAVAALLAALLPLAAYAAARGLLRWGRGASALAALLLAANASLLFATHFSWQQQAAGTAFAFAAAAALRLGLEPEAPRRELVLAALLAAAALATYRLGFAPYLAALLGAVVASNSLSLATARRSDATAGSSNSLLLAGRRAGAFALAAAVLAVPSLVALGRGLPEFVASGGFSTAFKRAFPDGHPAEALGLVPRVWAREEEWPAALAWAWVAIASLVALAALVAGGRALVRQRRFDFVAGGAALTAGAYLVLLIPTFASYLSYKVLAYGAPFLVLLVVAAGRPARVAAVALAVPSAVVATVYAVDARLPPTLAGRAPQGALVAVETEDPWAQAWALYELRDHPLSVERPSFILTAQGEPIAPERYRHGGARYEVAGEGDELSLTGSTRK